MKNILLYTTLFLLAATTVIIISCNKGDDDKENNTNCSLIPAKLIRIDCDRTIFQLDTSLLLGDASWTDVSTGITYTNVVMNPKTCAIKQATNNYSITTLYVDVTSTVDTGFVNGCPQCLAYSVNPPQHWVEFTTISAQNCKQ